MAKTKSEAVTGEPAAPKKSGGHLQKYLDKAVAVLNQFGVISREDSAAEMLRLLDEVKYVDEPRVLAISQTLKHMSTFNQLVRENVENISIGSRYLQISEAFDSVREDSKTLIAQLDDGKIGLGERLQNLWMRLRRGTPSDRFDKIAETYRAVSRDTKDQLDREDRIMDGYIDFRFALKEAEILAGEVLKKHEPLLDRAREGLAAAQSELEKQAPAENASRSRLELARDEARHKFETEDRTYQLLKDIVENLTVGYDVGETLIAKLKQTHDVKDRVYRRAVTFFTTNEHVFTILGTVYTSQHGLHEATQATEALKKGANKGLEDVAELGRELEKAAIKAGYGSTLSAESVQKLVDAIANFQVESLHMVADLRKQSEENAKEIRRVVEQGKRRYQETVAAFASGKLPARTKE